MPEHRSASWIIILIKLKFFLLILWIKNKIRLKNQIILPHFYQECLWVWGNTLIIKRDCLLLVIVMYIFLFHRMCLLHINIKIIKIS
nr:hypothetical protein PHKIIMPN_00057 [Escherichia coli]